MNHSSTDAAPTVLDADSPAFALLTSDLADRYDDSPSVPPIDMKMLLNRCLGNVEFARLLLDEFQSSVPQQMAGLAVHASEDNLPAIRDAAHSLKGTAGTLAAEGLRQAASDLEAAAIADDWRLIPKCVERVHQESLRCLAEISHHRLVAKAFEFANS